MEEEKETKGEEERRLKTDVERQKNHKEIRRWNIGYGKREKKNIEEGVIY